MDDDDEVVEEEHRILVGFELGPLAELERRKIEHDAEKRSRNYWAKEILIQTNRVPDATDPGSFVAFATAVARDCVDFLGSFAKNNLVPLGVINQWHEKMVRKIQLNPFWWTKPPGEQ